MFSWLRLYFPALVLFVEGGVVGVAGSNVVAGAGWLLALGVALVVSIREQRRLARERRRRR